MGLSPSDIVFYLLSACVVASALVVTFSANLVFSAFALLGTLIGTAALYVLLQADFLAAAQVLVYVGGIAVLFLFAVMLTHHITDARTSNSHFGRAIAIPAGIFTTGICAYAAVGYDWPISDVLNSNPTVKRIGSALLNEYLLPFEFASVILLVVLVGAALVARREVNLRLRRQQGNS
jgi:NADH:ubiquinone oxidoreductase subunit 6 (subunit J)